MLAAYAVNRQAVSWHKPKIFPFAIFILQISPLQPHLTCTILLNFYLILFPHMQPHITGPPALISANAAAAGFHCCALVSLYIERRGLSRIDFPCDMSFDFEFPCNIEFPLYHIECEFSFCYFFINLFVFSPTCAILSENETTLLFLGIKRLETYIKGELPDGAAKSYIANRFI